MARPGPKPKAAGDLSRRLNVTISPDLFKRLEAHRHRLNISALVEEALSSTLLLLEEGGPDAFVASNPWLMEE